MAYIVRKEYASKSKKITRYFAGTVMVPFFGKTLVFTTKIEEAKVFIELTEAEEAANFMGKGAEVLEKIYK